MDRRRNGKLHTVGLGSEIMACIYAPFDRMSNKQNPVGDCIIILGGIGLRVGFKHSVKTFLV